MVPSSETDARPIAGRRPGERRHAAGVPLEAPDRRKDRRAIRVDWRPAKGRRVPPAQANANSSPSGLQAKVVIGPPASDALCDRRRRRGDIDDHDVAVGFADREPIARLRPSERHQRAAHLDRLAETKPGAVVDRDRANLIGDREARLVRPDGDCLAANVRQRRIPGSLARPAGQPATGTR